MRPKNTEEVLSDRIPSSDVRQGPAKVLGLQDIESTGRTQVEAQKTRGNYFPSFVVAGLSLLTAVFATVLPTTMHFLNEYNVARPPFALMMLIVQSILLPPLVCFSFAAATIMFWYGSVTLRFVLAIATVLPGCFTFYLCVCLVDIAQPNDGFLIAFGTCMFASLLVTAAIAVTMQLWGRWTLTHQREQSVFPPTGIVSIVELTLVAAVGSAVFSAVDARPYHLGILLFGGIALFAAPTVMASMISCFRAEGRFRFAAFVAVCSAFAGAFFLNGFFAALEFGGAATIADQPLMLASISFYGAALICGLTWLCQRWLRFCGWQCMKRLKS